MHRRLFLTATIASLIAAPFAGAARGAIDPAFLAKVRALISPGTSLIVTDAPVNTNTKSSSNMSVLTAFKME